MKNKFVSASFVIITCLILVACAEQPHSDSYSAPGFFMGIVHGICAPFSLVAEIFTDVRIYAFPNSGGWYDFGFILGIGALGGGAARR